MASRAPTLSKPKTKPKVATKSILSKTKASPTLKTASTKASKSPSKAVTVTAKAVSSKSAATTPALKPTTKAVATKAVVVKSESAKAHSAHPAVAKPKLLKSTSVKPAAAPESKATEGSTPDAVQTPKPRRRTKGEIRTRIYWAVFNTDLRRVAVFEFDQRDEAQRRASKLAETSGEHHFIQKIKAIVQ